MGFCRLSQSLFKRLIGRAYVESIRNLPPLVLIFIFYFFVSDQIMPILGVDEFIRNCSQDTQAFLSFFFAQPMLFSAFVSALITLAIFEGAYITEIVRAGNYCYGFIPDINPVLTLSCSLIVDRIEIYIKK